jgi:hypothetical protein
VGQGDRRRLINTYSQPRKRFFHDKLRASHFNRPSG